MVSKRRRFTHEFKIEAVGLATNSDHSVPKVAQDLKIHPTIHFIDEFSNTVRTLLMIALIGPPIFAVMKPAQRAEKGSSDPSLN